MLGEYISFAIGREMEFVLRLVISCICGGVIGFERSRRRKEAGLRTHIIVALGSALLMIVSKYGFMDIGDVPGMRVDAARIAANVITGISFLGAGMIFVRDVSIKGLTTAAGIWSMAGIGLAIGAGMYFVGIFANRSVKGDHCDAPALPKARLWTDLSKSVLPWDISSATTTLSEVIVEQDDALPAPRVVAMFGDSIMQQGAWVTPFTARLYEHFRGGVSVCNLGIGGNRLLYGATPASRGMYGHAGIERYRYDLLPIEGLTHAVFALGTNDLGHPGTGGAPEEELITVDQYAAAARTIADALHKQGVKVYAGLILPREVNHLFPPEREALRRAINRWIAEEGPFDAVLDLGAPIADTDDGVGMKKEFALPDGLHPNEAGAERIAKKLIGFFGTL